ncbi:MAG: hypothetical protein JJ971_13055 [Balneolaceae bacterium]|nr:hypothetical protein [Balneolaceae bacterium]MBO6547218.1 hypothetical protein [Balneolaceae bacterium]MBO6647835.1 hypothetical protein [Balneolaceae bacterium]
MRQLAYLLIICSVFFSSTSLSAQENDPKPRVTALVNISAEVVQSIQLITVNSMTFGNVQPGQLEIYVNPINDVNAGYMIAVGTPGAEFRLDFQQIRNLTNVEDEGFLTFQYELSGNDTEDQSSSVLIENENRSIIFNEEGEYHIWVGGRVNIENATPGSYEGDFTIEIDYI